MLRNVFTRPSVRTCQPSKLTSGISADAGRAVANSPAAAQTMCFRNERENLVCDGMWWLVARNRGPDISELDQVQMVLQSQRLRPRRVGNAGLGKSARWVEAHVSLDDLSVQRHLDENGVFDLLGWRAGVPNR